MSRELKIGVVGAGVFGGYHANKCAAHSRVEYVGTYDRSLERAQSIASPRGGRAFRNYGVLLAACDAVIIATPASQHGEMALRALKSGCHTLIEKPIATSRVAAQRCLDAAALNGLVLQVGHQERFVAKAIGLDRISEQPNRIEAKRHSPYSTRGTDVSVTLDLKLTYPSGSVTIDFNAKILTQTAGFDLNANFGDTPLARDSLGAATDSFVSAILDGTPIEITGGHGLRALDAALRVDGD